MKSSPSTMSASASSSASLGGSRKNLQPNSMSAADDESSTVSAGERIKASLEDFFFQTSLLIMGGTIRPSKVQVAFSYIIRTLQFMGFAFNADLFTWSSKGGKPFSSFLNHLTVATVLPTFDIFQGFFWFTLLFVLTYCISLFFLRRFLPSDGSSSASKKQSILARQCMPYVAKCFEFMTGIGFIPILYILLLPLSDLTNTMQNATVVSVNVMRALGCVVGTIFLIMTIPYRTLVLASNFLSKNVLAKPHGRCDAALLIHEALTILAYVVLPVTALRHLLITSSLFLASVFRLYMVVFYQPYYNSIMNRVESFCAGFVCCSFAGTVVTQNIFPSDEYVAYVIFALLFPFGFVAAIGSRFVEVSATDFFKTPGSIYHVEVSARPLMRKFISLSMEVTNVDAAHLRKASEQAEQDPDEDEEEGNAASAAASPKPGGFAAADNAEDPMTALESVTHDISRIFKRGNELFPKDSYVGLTHALFKFCVLQDFAQGFSAIRSAESQSVPTDLKFQIFLLRSKFQSVIGSRGQDNGGEIDLVSFLEYQRDMASARDYHRSAQSLLFQFWRLLAFDLRSEIDLSQPPLDRLVFKLQQAITTAKRTYSRLLKKYQSPKIAFMYASFLQDVLCESSSANEVLDRAHEMEEANSRKLSRQIEGDGMAMSSDLLDETCGIISIDDKGTVQTVNSMFVKVFGYKRSAILGQNIKMIMPNPYRQNHDSYLHRYMQTGVPHIIGGTRFLCARHANGEIFPIRLTVHRVEMGQDVMFTGIVQQVSENTGMLTVSNKFSILGANDRALRMIGLPLKKVRMHPVARFLPEFVKNLPKLRTSGAANGLRLMYKAKAETLVDVEMAINSEGSTETFIVRIKFKDAEAEHAADVPLAAELQSGNACPVVSGTSLSLSNLGLHNKIHHQSSSHLKVARATSISSRNGLNLSPDSPNRAASVDLDDGASLASHEVESHNASAGVGLGLGVAVLPQQQQPSVLAIPKNNVNRIASVQFQDASPSPTLGPQIANAAAEGPSNIVSSPVSSPLSPGGVAATPRPTASVSAHDDPRRRVYVGSLRRKLKRAVTEKETPSTLQRLSIWFTIMTAVYVVGLLLIFSGTIPVSQHVSKEQASLKLAGSSFVSASACATLTRKLVFMNRCSTMGSPTTACTNLVAGTAYSVIQADILSHVVDMTSAQRSLYVNRDTSHPDSLSAIYESRSISLRVLQGPGSYVTRSVPIWESVSNLMAACNRVAATPATNYTSKFVISDSDTFYILQNSPSILNDGLAVILDSYNYNSNTDASTLIWACIAVAITVTLFFFALLFGVFIPTLRKHNSEVSRFLNSFRLLKLNSVTFLKQAAERQVSRKQSSRVVQGDGAAAGSATGTQSEEDEEDDEIIRMSNAQHADDGQHSQATGISAPTAGGAGGAASGAAGDDDSSAASMLQDSNRFLVLTREEILAIQSTDATIGSMLDKRLAAIREQEIRAAALRTGSIWEDDDLEDPDLNPGSVAVPSGFHFSPHPASASSASLATSVHSSAPVSSAVGSSFSFHNSFNRLYNFSRRRLRNLARVKSWRLFLLRILLCQRPNSKSQADIQRPASSSSRIMSALGLTSRVPLVRSFLFGNLALLAALSLCIGIGLMFIVQVASSLGDIQTSYALRAFHPLIQFIGVEVAYPSSVPVYPPSNTGAVTALNTILTKTHSIKMNLMSTMTLSSEYAADIQGSLFDSSVANVGTIQVNGGLSASDSLLESAQMVLRSSVSASSLGITTPELTDGLLSIMLQDTANLDSVFLNITNHLNTLLTNWMNSFVTATMLLSTAGVVLTLVVHALIFRKALIALERLRMQSIFLLMLIPEDAIIESDNVRTAITHIVSQI